MTVIEELAHIAGSLGPDAQRRLLEVAIQLRQSSTPDLAGIPGADASEATWKAWRERLGELQEAALLAEKARLMSLNLINVAWEAQTEVLPRDMLAASDSSVET
jgi:hypothetical protein